MFHTGPPGSSERGSANCNDRQADEQSDRAPAREPRAVQPGPQPHRGGRGHPGLSEHLLSTSALQGCRAGSYTEPELHGKKILWGSG